MTPLEFIESLQRHYAKRHRSDDESALWMQDILGVVNGSDRKVLRKAYELIRDEHTERAFPLPAQLKKWISRAADIVHPESKSHSSYHYNGPSKRAPDTPEEIEACRKAREWQTEIIAKHGTWAAWWRTVKHNYDDGKFKRTPEVENTPATAGNVDWQRGQRPAFEALQHASRNRHMLKPALTSRSRAMSGDRE